jgi:hypothetical protein
MKSGLVSPSQLLASFLGKEQEKIGHGIAQSDFAGELKKFLSPTKQESALSPTGTVDSQTTVTQTATDSAQPATETAATPADCQTLAASSTGKKKASSLPDGKAQIKNQKTKAKNGEDLLVTDAVTTETILSNLQCPAEIIKACKSIQNKDGMISLKDLKALLDSQVGTTGASSSAQISAEQVRSLLGSITMQGGSAGGNTLQSGSGKLPASIKVKQNGSYTLAEFSGLLDQVMQQGIQTPGPKTIQSLQANTASTSSSAEITGQAEMSPKAGQTESLTSSALPSFVSESLDGQMGNGAKSASDGSSGQEKEVPAQQPTDGDVQEKLKKVQSAEADTDRHGPALDIRPKQSAGYNDLGSSLNEEKTGPQGNSLPTVASPPGEAASGGQNAAGANMSIEDLTSVAESFNAKVVSGSPEVILPDGGSTETLIKLQQNSAVPPQNFSVIAKEAEKQADAKSSSETAQMIAASPKSDQAENRTAPVLPSSLSESPDDRSGAQKGTPDRFMKPAAEILKSDAGTIQDQKMENSVITSGSEQTEAANDGIKQVAPEAGRNTAAYDTVEGPVAESVQPQPASNDEVPISVKNTSDDIQRLGKLSPAVESSAQPQGLAKVSGTPGQEKGPEVQTTLSIASDTASRGPVSEMKGVENTGVLSGDELQPNDKAVSEANALSVGKVSRDTAEVTTSDSKQGQAETVSASTVPSFASEDSKEAVASQSETRPDAAQQQKEQMSSAEAAREASKKPEGASPTVVGKQANTESIRSGQPPGEENYRKNLSSTVVGETQGKSAPASPVSNATASPVNPSTLNPADNDPYSNSGSFNSKAAPADLEGTGLIAGGTENQNTLRQGTAIPVQGMAAAVKETEKQFSEKTASLDSVVLQNAGNRLQGDQINLPQLEKSPGESLSYYDPNRAAELVQTYREQIRNTGGQLTLEMEPEGFGKLNIKVGTKKNEVSAQILTENEAARQTLLKNSPELRQELQNQGLALGKFNVDVGSDKSGNGENLPEWVKPGMKEASVKTKEVEPLQVKPVYMRVKNGQSSLSIFA